MLSGSRIVVDALRRFKHSLKRRCYDSFPTAALGAIVRLKMPRSAQLEVTTTCNLRCPLCITHDVDRGSKRLTLEHVRNVVRSAGRRLKVVSFHLLGEPLLHPQLFEFVAFCAQSGVRTTFSTNGMLIDRRIDEILDSGLTQISIAIDGATSEDYAKYRIGGRLDTVVRNTRMLIEARKRRGTTLPRIQVQMVMFSYNEDKESEAIAFLNSLGADQVSLKRPSYSNPERQESNRFLEQVDHRNSERRYARSTESPERLYRNRRICPQLERAVVLSDGRMVACCMDSTGATSFGNLNEADFDDIWRGREHRRILELFARRELPMCQHCTLGDHP